MVLYSLMDRQEVVKLSQWRDQSKIIMERCQISTRKELLAKCLKTLVSLKDAYSTFTDNWVNCARQNVPQEGISKSFVHSYKFTMRKSSTY